MTNYFENLRKRIIWIAVGVLCYYFAVIPLSLVPHFLLPGTAVSYFSGFSLYSLVSFGLLFYFVYRAVAKVDPPLTPLLRKYKKILLISTVILFTLLIALPSGMIVPDWEQGECIVSSTAYAPDGEPMGGTTSQSIGGKSDCLSHCKYDNSINHNDDSTCQFRGIFGSEIVFRTSEDFANSDGKIKFNGKLK